MTPATSPVRVDVAIPTYRRPAALAVTLAGLVGQTWRPLRIIVSSQSPEDEPVAGPEALAAVRVLRAQGREVELHRHLPRRGMAEQRQFLLDQATAPLVLFLDDDVLLEPDLVERLVAAIGRSRCGFVGSAVVGLSFVDDERPSEQAIELWDAEVEPEDIQPGSSAWTRHRLHNAANLHHLRRRLGPGDRLYRVAWVGGCVLYDTAKLRASGGYEFWPQLPVEHAGEDVLAQLNVQRRFGGAGLFPSGAYHLELPTTIPDRRVDAPYLLQPVSHEAPGGNDGHRHEDRTTPASKLLEPVGG
jgi:glycosyltransferase involved in cell wall biosynthesis